MMRRSFLHRAMLRAGGRCISRRGALPASTVVLVVGLLAALAAFAGALIVSLGDLRGALATSESQAQLLARVLEDQTTRTFESGELVLSTLAQTPALHAGALDRDAAEDAMRQVLTALTFVRSVAVLNLEGQVLASTDPAASGIRIDRARLGPLPTVRSQRIGPLLPGRGLESLRSDAPATAMPPGLAFIPLMYGFRDETGTPLVLVALVNPDALSNFQYLAVETLSYDAVIASDDGQVLASSIFVHDLPQRDISALPVFSRLPENERGSYAGPGVLGPDRIVAYRASRSRPLVVIVEEPRSAAVARWFASYYPLLAVEAAMVLLALALTWIAWRSLRSREAARRAVDAAQERIVRSERDLALLLRSVQELIFRTDREGAITYVNARWTALSGHPPSAAIGQRLQDLVQPDSRDRVAAMLDPHSGAAVRTRQVRLLSPQGGERVLDVAAVPLAEADGAPLGFVGSAVDVTEREQAYHRLRAQLAFQNLLLETSPQPMMLTDRSHRVVLVNRAWEQAMGRHRDLIVGENLELYPGEAADDAAIAEGGGGRTLEMDLPYGDGVRRATRVLKAAVEVDRGEATGVLSILMDISEFREAERATREARDAAEESARTRSEFVANMSHELRTPLQAIIGFAELGTARTQDTRLWSMFTDIHAAGRRLLALVNDLLDVAKIESSIGTFHLERTDLRGHVRTVARELEPLIASRRQELRIDLPQGPLVAKVDPQRFQQVVRNVLANAIKFSPDGSCVQLRAAVDCQDMIHIEVEDQGPGIPENELERIFEAFAQSSATRNGFGGTGLGLAICRKIAEALQGRIHARNVEGGAVFHIELPARGPADAAPAPQ